MTPWIFASIYVAGVVLVVVLDGLYGKGDDALAIAVLWPIVVFTMPPVLFFVGLKFLHEKLRRETGG